MTSPQHSQAMRWFVMVILTVATAGMFAVSMRANFLYGYGIGQSHDTRLAIAWANVAADLWKGFGLIVVVALWRSAWRRAATAISMTWLICLAFSVSSAIGIYVQERTALTSGREAQHATYDAASSEFASVERKIKNLAPYRPAAQVEATIAGVFARPVVINDRARGTVASLSAHCTKNETRTAAECVEVAALRAELAVAQEAARLDARAQQLREQLQALRERGSSSAPDPVGEFWAWITRGLLSVRDVGFGLPLFFALMIEMVSAFGPLGIVSYAEVTRDATRRDMAGHVVLQRAEASLPVPRHAPTEDAGRIVQYMAERTEPTASPAGLGADELYGDYELWCVSKGQRALSEAAFIDEFDRVRESPQLAGKIKKFRTRYFGIALLDSAMQSVTSRELRT